jgi:hypothetical protein
VNSLKIRKHTRICTAIAAFLFVAGVVGVIVGQGGLMKSALALSAAAATISFTLLALAIHRTPPSD